MFNKWIHESEVMFNMMLCFLEDITKWIGDRSPVDIIYVDFQKAFDKVCQKTVCCSRCGCFKLEIRGGYHKDQ